MTAASPWADESIAANGFAVSENFRAWFGDSKMVLPNGDPQVYFHGTRSDFDAFRQSPDIAGYFFTLPVFARVKNPFVFYPSEESLDAMVNGELLEQVLPPEVVERVVDRIDREGMGSYGDELRLELEARGHDGIVMVYPESSGPLQGANVVIVWEPEQLKSAIGNSGLFEEGPSLSDRSEDVKFRRSFRRP